MIGRLAVFVSLAVLCVAAIIAADFNRGLGNVGTAVFCLIAGIGAAGLGIAIIFASTSVERSKALLRRIPLRVQIASACTVAVVVSLAVMYMVTNRGTVKVELSDPNAKVEVKIDKQGDIRLVPLK
jgi:hypothetical protein